MRIDLHVHTRFSPDSFMDLEVLARRCAETGLDCIAVTDHNTIDGALEMQRLAPFPVIVGEEIKSSGGEIIGLFLREAVPRGLPPLETVWLVKEQGGLVSVPHPFDHFRRSVIERAALQEILPHVDIIEAFNARNTLQRDNRSAEALALEHGILTSSVTDSHTPVEVGRCYVETPAFDLTPAGLLEGLARGTQVRRQMLPLIHFATTVTKTRKRLAACCSEDEVGEAVLKVGWFSTGRGEGSLGLLRTVMDAIGSGELQAQMEFVFSNREPGEAEGSDRFVRQVLDYGIPLVTLSSQRFRREQSGGPFSRHRKQFDREVMRLLEPYRPDVCVLAGYMLITAAELCNRYTMLNLHPALPGGPVGTWQEVIWSLIAEGAKEAGSYMHLATEDLDRGPVLTYCSFPIRGGEFETLWQQIEGRSVEELRASEGEEQPLFRLIREEGVRRERPLVLETLKAFAGERVRVVERRVVDGAGNPIDGLCLNEAVERAVRDAG